MHLENNISSESELIRIQNVLLCDSMELESTRNMYCRNSEGVRINGEGACYLPRGEYYDFFTCLNSLPIMAWKQYTNANEFFLVIDLKGEFEVEVFGHFKTNGGFQKEWVGRHSPHRLLKRDKIVIPCSSFNSVSIGFGLYAISDVLIYDAYYAADIGEIGLKRVKLAIVSNDDKYNYKNKINKEIFEKTITGNYLKSVEINWIESEGGKKNINDMSDEQYTHVIDVEEDVLISPDSINRLCAMLTLLKDEYTGSAFRATAMDRNRPNFQRALNIKDIDIYDLDIATEELDMNLWDSVIENEERNRLLSPVIKSDDGWGFSCRPISYCDETEKNESDSILFNGLFSWTLSEDNEQESRITLDNGEELIRLQNILLKESLGVDVTKHMYYRSKKDLLVDERGLIHLQAGCYYEFFTYYNSLSLGKWKKFTNIKEASLFLDIKGDFEIDLFGHYQVGTNIQKENFIKTSRNFNNKTTFGLSYPTTCQSIVVAFGIYTKSDVIIYDAYYGAKVNKSDVKQPKIAMVTTTFKKEEFIKRNIALLTEHLFSDERFKDSFFWNIIDNGKTLGKSVETDYIKVTPNSNLGGAGGFARGMMVSLRQNVNYSHILLMDDDVVFIPDSFKRLYVLLSLIKDEYSDYFVSGAMLNMDAPNIQHENTGKLVEEGYCIPLHSGRDLNKWDQVLLNEIDTGDLSYRYAAWWFCCIPTTVATKDNLPLPVFVRGDDMEYSLRNNAKFITMNGISISHMGFVGKFNAPMDFYQSKRNELIVFTTVPSLSKIDSFGCIKDLFWQELYKFDYIGAEFLADAVEDFLKGPEWFSSVDLFDELQKRRKRDNKPKAITDEIRSLIDYGTLYDHKEMTKRKKFLYDYTYNGQARIPLGNSKKKIGIIPYNFSYYPSRQQLTSVNYAIDPVNDKYVEFRKDKNRFKELKARWEKLETDYIARKEELTKRYQEYEKEITNIDFWDDYIEKLSK